MEVDTPAPQGDDEDSDLDEEDDDPFAHVVPAAAANAPGQVLPTTSLASG